MKIQFIIQGAVTVRDSAILLVVSATGVYLQQPFISDLD